MVDSVGRGNENLKQAGERKNKSAGEEQKEMRRNRSNGGRKWNCHHFIISNDIASGIHFIYNSLYGILDGTTFISTNNFVVIVLRDNYCHKDSSFFVVFTF